MPWETKVREWIRLSDQALVRPLPPTSLEQLLGGDVPYAMVVRRPGDLDGPQQAYWSVLLSRAQDFAQDYRDLDEALNVADEQVRSLAVGGASAILREVGLDGSLWSLSGAGGTFVPSRREGIDTDRMQVSFVGGTHCLMDGDQRVLAHGSPADCGRRWSEVREELLAVRRKESLRLRLGTARGQGEGGLTFVVLTVRAPEVHDASRIHEGCRAAGDGARVVVLSEEADGPEVEAFVVSERDAVRFPPCEEVEVSYATGVDGALEIRGVETTPVRSYSP